MKFTPALILAVLLSAFFSCSEDDNGFRTAEVPNARFSSIQTNVFDRSCAISGCHNGSERPNLSSGVAYDNIVAVASSQGADYIDSGEPALSYLYLKLTGGNIDGDRMPRDEAPLSSQITDSIRVWIQNGAANN